VCFISAQKGKKLGAHYDLYHVQEGRDMLSHRATKSPPLFFFCFWSFKKTLKLRKNTGLRTHRCDSGDGWGGSTLDPTRAQTEVVHLAGLFLASLSTYFTCTVKGLLAQNANRQLSWDIRLDFFQECL